MRTTTAAAGVSGDVFTDPGINDSHRSALRSIQRVVAETAPPTPPAEALAQVTSQLREGPALVLTGAGVSTDSGIPDYRGPGGSLSRHRPMTYQEFRHDPAASHRYWARSFVGWRQMDAAAPNRTHFALVELERAGYLAGVITQNVDGLHRAAGSGNLLHLHGDLDTVMCLDCGHREDRRIFGARLDAANPGYLAAIAVDPAMVNPDGDVTLPQSAVERFVMVGCVRCGSVRLKPDVVYFGEPVPVERKERASSMLDQAASLLVVGSSLAVMSGYRFVLDAQRQGKKVAVINGGPGRADGRVEVLWRTPVAPAFDALLDELGL
ncbi:Sir2 family NAD-dependent protein deacetylase [Corynebacterium sp.]|uniref:Sir2 family NAD-dependent protein deacetylase n=1 Tax=Corynebacterium sp. TaxID=1720 RepID=UPI0026DEB069|nr:Sir2 family NAD-dependent protein deacetylase [Corynebacterium sp.]MDO5512802.1 Sir2 family NAD-dependent protein deacetylase [Corynebacterium sp.]